ncbi:efflux RND transporter periplasmic adaptor subunit [Vogesella sp. LIG4]|uniref:efflux RND transporter periplasmic adaptor subunit n=1 Tax=Vogesella sp. LIG4 TaxID=1192162 RepID=UPI001E35C93B|nr:efflux RND transporter periplasmic adaptor subunit [Vogesella sp. LIG4]
MPLLAVPLAVLVWWLLPPAVSVVTLHSKAVQFSVVSTGRVAAQQESALSSTVTGRVVATPVEAGDAVHAGQLLLRLEPEELRALQQQAMAQLASAQSTLQDAQRQWQRQRQLFDQGFISQAALDAARLARDAANHSVVQLQALVRQNQVRLGQSDLRAPVDGTVLRRDVEVGDVITAGKEALLFGSAGRQRVLLDLDERDVGQLAVGQQAAVLADAFAQRPVAARVSRVSPRVDQDSGTVEVELQLLQPAAFLKSGMTVSAEIRTSAARQTLLLPLAALRDGQVAVVSAEHLHWRVVRTGIAVAGYLPVQSGLRAGEQVVLPAPQLKDGQRVRVQP